MMMSTEMRSPRGVAGVARTLFVERLLDVIGTSPVGLWDTSSLRALLAGEQESGGMLVGNLFSFSCLASVDM